MTRVTGEPYVTHDGHDVSGTYHGIHIIDCEDGAAALTHDPTNAMLAIRAFYSHTGDPLLDAHEPHVTTGWLRYELRDDGEWVVATDAMHPDARPATWITL